MQKMALPFRHAVQTLLFYLYIHTSMVIFLHCPLCHLESPVCFIGCALGSTIVLPYVQITQWLLEHALPPQHHLR